MIADPTPPPAPPFDGEIERVAHGRTGRMSFGRRAFLAGVAGASPGRRCCPGVAAAVEPGASFFESLAPQRLCDTRARPGLPAGYGYIRLDDRTIRVSVAGERGHSRRWRRRRAHRHGRQLRHRQLAERLPGGGGFSRNVERQLHAVRLGGRQPRHGQARGRRCGRHPVVPALRRDRRRRRRLPSDVGARRRWPLPGASNRSVRSTLDREESPAPARSSTSISTASCRPMRSRSSPTSPPSTPVPRDTCRRSRSVRRSPTRRTSISGRVRHEPSG